MRPSEIAQTMENRDWRSDIETWVDKQWKASDSTSDGIVSFFHLAFDNTRCPEHAWFGVHKSAVSLVVGGIFLAAITKTSIKDSGFWLLLDQAPPLVDGVEYKPVKATRASAFQLMWAHSESLSAIPKVNANDLIWRSFASASEKIRYSPIGGDRDSVQLRRNKKRLSDFWFTRRPANIYPEEIEEEGTITEGARHQVIVNAYERDSSARLKCIDHYGTRCFVCGFSFQSVYGEVAKDFIHVHHLKPLSEIGSEYTLDPVKDLRPVCPNCHAVLHLGKPVFSIEEVMEFLRKKPD